MKLNWQWCVVLALGVSLSVANIGCQPETPPAGTGSGSSSSEGEASTTETPTTETPTTETPTTETPTTETPTTETPTTETPTTETPTTETPVTETPVTETPAEDDHEALEAIMEKLAKPPVALNGKIGEGLAADPIDWATVAPNILELHAMATELGTLTPPKGDADSWMTQTASFLAACDELKAACEAQDAAAAQAAHGKIKMSCGPCHMEHKPE